MSLPKKGREEIQFSYASVIFVLPSNAENGLQLRNTEGGARGSRISENGLTYNVICERHQKEIFENLPVFGFCFSPFCLEYTWRSAHFGLKGGRSKIWQGKCNCVITLINVGKYF